MSIFKHLSYREIIKDRIENWKKSGKNYNFAALAKDMRLQAPYISKVMNGQADFNNDQLSDIYFISNMSANELYINQGELKFQRSNEAAGSKPWSTDACWTCRQPAWMFHAHAETSA